MNLSVYNNPLSQAIRTLVLKIFKSRISEGIVKEVEIFPNFTSIRIIVSVFKTAVNKSLLI